MFIGVDLGTSSVKLILVKANGEIVRTISKENRLIIPKPSWTEQDPDEWYKNTISGLKELVLGYEDKIEAMSFSGQMHGLVILDENDFVIRNAILWNDQRTIKEVEYLNTVIGKDKLIEYTGNIALTGLTAPKLLWVKNNEVENFKKIKKIMLPKDYLVYKLSGVFASDVSDSSGTLYFDVKNRKYNNEMLNILKINLTQLPKIFESYEVVGQLKSQLSKDLDLKKQIKIIAGGGDQAVGAIGMGIVNNGKSSLSLGTSGVIFVANDQFEIDKKSHFQSYCHANGKYLTMAVMLNAAGVLKWWSENIFKNRDYDKYFLEVEESKIENEIFFLPYLSGERAPINDPNAQGVFFGLNLSTNKEDLDRAVVEGITFALNDSFVKMKENNIMIDAVRITGGGAKSKVWAQMCADILNVKVSTIHTSEGPAFGASILAMVGNKTYSSCEEACEKLIKVDKTYSPNKHRVDIYKKKYQKFQKIYPQIKQLFTEYIP